MYIAELKGKLSSRVAEKEDLLTSNVFSFLKYADRQQFLRPFLAQIGILLQPDEAEQADFIFWPVFQDGTEPDLIIIAGRYYLLFEAKYGMTLFGQERGDMSDQLTREYDGGTDEAHNKNKEFHMFAITADYSRQKKLAKMKSRIDFHWINWQLITSFLERHIDIKGNAALFAVDLYNLLVAHV